jgi:hypothetical protein
MSSSVRRTGRGAGVDYLDATALEFRKRRNPWAFRTLHIRRAAAPELENAESYEVRNR